MVILIQDLCYSCISRALCEWSMLMSISVRCPRCGVLIGEIVFNNGVEFVTSFVALAELLQEGIVNCDHLEPKKTNTKKLFGLINQIHVEYPETNTTSLWNEYTGPLNKFMLWVAICFIGRHRGILINKKWAWWDTQSGFFGEGVQEFEKLQAKAI